MRKTTRLLAATHLLLLAWAAVALLRPAAALAAEATLTDDAYTVSGVASNFGAKNSLRISSTQKAWVKVDLGNLPFATTSGDVTNGRYGADRCDGADGCDGTHGPHRWHWVDRANGPHGSDRYHRPDGCNRA